MVNIATFVKASINLNLIKVESNGKVNTEESPLAISEYDKNALEEAIRIKEKLGGKVVAISILTWGPISKKIQDLEKIGREILAIGADECHLVIDEALIGATTLETSIVAANLVRRLGNFDLYITGEYSQDTTSSQFPSRLAAILGLPLATFVNKLEVKEGEVIAYRSIENEIQKIKLRMPCVISVTGEINQPRIPTLRQILQAKNKPLIRYDLKQLSLNLDKAKLEQEIVALEVKRKNIIIEGKSLEEIADKLIDKLLEEGAIKL